MSDPRDQTDHDFERIEGLLRDIVTEDRERVEPPESVWAGIEAALADDRADDETSAAAEPEPQPQAEIISLDSRRRIAPRLILSAAAAVAVVVAGIVAFTVDGNSEPIVVAGADLAYDPDLFDPAGADAVAHVSLLEDEGAYRLAVDEADLPTPGDEAADLELWLIQPDESGAVADLVSLGLVDPADPGTYELPVGLDPSEFSVVDISVEPRDGDETHSGRSILRAPLTFA